MARKPIHLQAAGKLTPRDRVWAAVRALKHFGYAEIADFVVDNAPAEASVRRIEEDTIESYVLSLEAAGYLRREPGARKRREKVCFDLVRDVGVHAPRVTKAGETVTQGSARLAMWNAMRKLKQFSRSSLAHAASTEADTVTDEEAKTYIYYLLKASYLAVRDPGNTHRQATYVFIPSRNSGWRAPQIQRVRHVYDPNLGRVVWHPEADT